MKRLSMLLLAFIVCLTFIVPSAFARDYQNHWAKDEIQRLVDAKIMKGYPDGTFRPEAGLTRAEFTELVVKTVGLNKDTDLESAGLPEEMAFSDVGADDWFHDSVMNAVKAGIITGYEDNTFRPDRKITREQMAVMIQRTLDSQGYIYEEGTELTFADKNTIGKDYAKAVKVIYDLKIMNGKPGNLFAPRDETTRAQAATVIVRMRELLDPSTKVDFQVATKDGNIIKAYPTFADAKANVKSGQVIQTAGKIIWMPYGMGIAATNKFTEIYDDAALKRARTYVPTGTELKYLEATDTYVKVSAANKVGYVKQDHVNLIPSNERSYFTVADGYLRHTIFNPLTGKPIATNRIGKAPGFMQPGQKYYSWDGYTFTDRSGQLAGTAYQYFNVLPLGTKTDHTAADLDKYIRDNYIPRNNINKSPLEGYGKVFKEIEAKYQVNGLYLMAHAIHESAWGTSAIAQDKKNLFGLRATDNNAYDNAKSYKTFEESIEHAAQYVSTMYQNPNGAYYNGAVLGNKAAGMNVKYASDPFWGEKIAWYMYQADEQAGFKDLGKYELGLTTEPNLNIRNKAGDTSAQSLLYTLKITNIPVIINKEVPANGAVWYHIHSDDQKQKEAFVHSSYVKKLPVAK